MPRLKLNRVERSLEDLRLLLEEEYENWEIIESSTRFSASIGDTSDYV